MSIRIGFTMDRGTKPAGMGLAWPVSYYNVGRTHSLGSRPQLATRLSPDHPVRRVVVGFLRYKAADLIPVVADGARIKLSVVGVLRLAKDISPELASAAFEHKRVVGIEI